MNLLLDMGNSRLKWALAIHSQLVSFQAIDNRELTSTKLTTLWQGLDRPEKIGVACVCAQPLLAIVKSTAQALWPETVIVEVNSKAEAFGVNNAYLHPEKLGVDRWLALVATRHHYPLPACIVDCGTAITVDLLDINGKHQGGLISPGLALMKQALSNGTEALPLTALEYQLAPANCTEAAIYSGTLSAAVGLVEQVLKNQPSNTQLVITGGDAQLIARHVKAAYTVDIDLVLRGLAIVLINPP